MTTARASRADEPTGFRRWRRTRPFWGGLLLLLSGVELLLSGNLNLTSVEFHIGPTGFLSYVIPAMVILCGVMSWLTPQVRMFYGVIGALVAVYSLIGVNLGGFFIGMLLGIVGAAMVIAWTPATPESTSEPGSPAAAPTAEAADDRADETWFLDEHGPDDRGPQQYGQHAQHYAEPQHPQQSYPQQYPQPAERQQQWWGNDQNEGDPPPPPPYGGGGGGNRGRLLGITLIPLTLAAGLLAAVPKVSPAYAAPPPCPTAGGASTAPRPTGSKPPAAGQPQAPGGAANTPAGQAPKPGAGQPADPKQAGQPAPSASAAPAAGGGGHSLADGWNDFVDGVKRFFGGGDKDEKAPEPTPSASTEPGSPTPSTQPGTGQPTAPKPPTPGQPNPKASGSAQPNPSAPAGADDKQCVSATVATDAAQPRVAVAPGILTAGVVTMNNVAFQGVVELPTATGTVRALKFTMSKNVTSPFQLNVPERAGVATQINSSELTTEGNVSFYTTKFTGKVAIFEHGLFPVTFKPDDPLLKLLPPIPLPQLQFTEATIELVYVQCNTLRAPNLSIKEIRA